MILHKAKDESVAENFFKYHYHDRGMMKWGGFFLSDHTSALKKQQQENIPNSPKKWQSQDYIGEILSREFGMKRTVSVQLSTVDEDGLLQDDVVGQVMGFDGMTAYIGENTVNIEEIRHIEVYL